ncbi:Mitochondrial tRNAs modification protein [Ophidiomyces ophidiicola]|nr:Mitochondrial tRNAs modification protein [Ophidiomyces ophidiicola]KAI1916921.1 Mitochondrial tRNAs modification protein [Ophidiomyces ophidiicola]KAI1922527.1 Mitochondrial tRNAs modification protein [Ophidiomyces ophidiicola]KAI1948667.1 Mitochondrial tRNAs modification protein [Ophidiomyces ophidiicola]KAI1951533.1 Mitochondrial tRNAs modification protein [Ophidiomyces ophidiicola]
MYATRVAKPKLSLNIKVASGVTALSIPSPASKAIPRTPLSPAPRSPTTMNTARNRITSHGHLSPMPQQASFTYSNTSSTKSILKKNSALANASTAKRKIQFIGEPTVHCVTPIENPDEYYGSYSIEISEGGLYPTRNTRKHTDTGSPAAPLGLSMLSLRAACRIVYPQRILPARRHAQLRQLLTLAIESSCDDTSVAIVEKHGMTSTSVHFLENITADSREYRGIHPIAALASHQQNLAKLVQKALRFLPPANEDDGNGRFIDILPADGALAPVRRRKPDFISVTRGPGMLSSLTTGVDTAKGLAVAWQIPLVGVHHMQAHLLTPRLATALEPSAEAITVSKRVEFPFLSLLVSGGHTLLVHSRSIVDHEILASTVDIAVGDALDKIGRIVLPMSYLKNSPTTMYGKALESFVFPNGKTDYAGYKPPASRGEEIPRRQNVQWGWSFTLPFSEKKILAFSFSGLVSEATKQTEDYKAIWKEMNNDGGSADDWLPYDARVALGREFMNVCFEHLASRTVLALQSLQHPSGFEHLNKKNRRKMDRKNAKGQAQAKSPVKTLVVSGGVAANQFLRNLLRLFLDVRGFEDIDIVAPPMYLCTDNAAMIGWAGIEMFEAGWKSDLKCRALKKWALDSRADDGGILGPEDWIRRE